MKTNILCEKDGRYFFLITAPDGRIIGESVINEFIDLNYLISPSKSNMIYWGFVYNSLLISN